jgi:hypothetical protein
LNADHGRRQVVYIDAGLVAEGAKPEDWKEAAASVLAPLDKESRSGAPSPTPAPEPEQPATPVEDMEI